ncbi:MAG: hypothetical protein AB1768_18260 [Pseudomonadota bacterium]|jgi:hypothetical protein
MSILLPVRDAKARAQAECLALEARERYRSAWEEIYLSFAAKPGRPHLRIGTWVLLRHPVALIIAAIQMVLVLFATWHARHIAGGLDALPAIAIFLVLGALSINNVLWVFMAATMAGVRPGARALLAAPMGWLPLRFVAWLFVPGWISPDGSWRGVISAQARLLQAGIAYGLALRRHPDLVLLDAAKVMAKRGLDVLDGLSSTIIYPVGILLFLLVLPDSLGGNIVKSVTDLVPRSVGAVGVAAYLMWLAYNRATLFAMMFALLNDARQDMETVPVSPDWSASAIRRLAKRSSLVALGLAALVLYPEVKGWIEARKMESIRQSATPPYIGSTSVPTERRGLIRIAYPQGISPIDLAHIRLEHQLIHPRDQVVSPLFLDSFNGRIMVPAGVYRVSRYCIDFTGMATIDEHLIDPAFAVPPSGVATLPAQRCPPAAHYSAAGRVQLVVGQDDFTPLQLEDEDSRRIITFLASFREAEVPVGQYRLYAWCAAGEEWRKELVATVGVEEGKTAALSPRPPCSSTR